MKKLLLIGLVGMTAAIAGSCAEDEALSLQDRTLLDEAKVRAARTETLYLTARGEGLAGQGWEHDSVAQARVAPEVAASALDTSEAGRIGIRVRVPGDSLVRASMDIESVDEGRLFRVHVDCPTSPRSVADRQAEVLGKSDQRTPGADTCDRVLIIGLYDGLWSEKAIDGQAYACRECRNGSTVCGSNPSCK
jgi:hypothetical protein